MIQNKSDAFLEEFENDCSRRLIILRSFSHFSAVSFQTSHPCWQLPFGSVLVYWYYYPFNCDVCVWLAANRGEILPPLSIATLLWTLLPLKHLFHSYTSLLITLQARVSPKAFSYVLPFNSAYFIFLCQKNKVLLFYLFFYNFNG